MIQEITIENYKSIQSLSIELGRVTVFIGENGCGKSNILEAIALGSAAAADKLDNEFLAPRGIRVTDPKLMRSAFDINNLDKEIKISFKYKNKDIIINYSLNPQGNSYLRWYEDKSIDLEQKELNKEYEFLKKKIVQNELQEAKINLESMSQIYLEKKNPEILEIFSRMINFEKRMLDLENKIQSIESHYSQSTEKYHSSFLIFCIEFTELREFTKEGQIEPLGINGQGLFKYLRYLSQPQFKEKLDEIKEKLELIDWFEDFDIPDNLYPGERTLKIKDRYLDPDLEYFDQKSANEGFLFLLFYFCLFIGEETPKFFAIDNIDSSLNPLLCRCLIEEIVELAKKHDKQVILTTHNPAALDGLDLHDEEQKLYVISRKLSGHTRADQVFPPKAPEGKKPVRLSEAFLRGYIGGLPENF
jgi:AAA15 family ATPase/GTPase